MTPRLPGDRQALPAYFRNVDFLESLVPAVVYGTVSMLILILPLGVDRSPLLDQQDYLEYFRVGPTFEWWAGFTDGAGGLLGAVNFFTEEVLWRLWTALVGSVVSPEHAVLITIFMINLLVVLAFRSLEHRVLGLILWGLSPVALATVGLIQIRQGFAYALFLFGALCLRRPVVAGLVAGLVHTTLAIPLVFCAVAWICGARRWLAVVLSSGLAVSLALAGGYLFDRFGGRRLEVYSASEGADSVNYVFLGLIFLLPCIFALSRRETVREVRVLAIANLGTVLFTITAFFTFPLGTSRIGYFIHLLMFPVLISLKSGTLSLLGVFAPVLIVMAYLVGKSFLAAEYAHLFWL